MATIFPLSASVGQVFNNYEFDGTSWNSIEQEYNPAEYSSTPPENPKIGDIWIDSDDLVPSIDSAQFLRWRKTMAGGETSLSGNDDASLPLQYTPGYEQLYINGVLQVRGQDYTATTGTTVTGLTALVANDTVEVFSAVARAVADVYTQTQSDDKYFTKQTSTTTSGEASTVNVNTKPWNMPWGVVAYTKTSTSNVTYTTEAQTIASSSFTAFANRYYKATYIEGTTYGSAVSEAAIRIRLTNSTGTLLGISRIILSNTASTLAISTGVFTLTAGTQTIVGTLSASTGTGTAYRVDSGASIIIEDIGPA